MTNEEKQILTKIIEMQKITNVSISNLTIGLESLTSVCNLLANDLYKKKEEKKKTLFEKLFG